MKRKTPDIGNLLNQLATQQQQLPSIHLLSPCVPGGLVRTRVASMIYIFIPQPHNFEGWGVFQPEDKKVAVVMQKPSLP